MRGCGCLSPFALTGRSAGRSGAFKPHLTLGRRMELTEAPDKEAVLGMPITAHVEQMTLMSSQRGEKGMRYTPLYRR